MKIKIRVNGSDTEIDNLNIVCLEDLVHSRNLKKQGLIAEVNNTIIHRERWQEKTLQEGDVIELINFVGGG